MPRYVILRHEMPPGQERASHWDVMLEGDGALRTWAVNEEPAVGCCLRGQALPDHRLAYLHYEGPIAEDRGEVRRWDQGTYRIVDECSPEAFVVELRGGRLKGSVRFERAADDPQRWVLSLFVP